MVSVVLLLVWISIIIYKCYYYMFHRPPNFPPGPPRLPILGAYLFLLAIDYKHLHKAIDRLCKYYKSNVLGFYYGPVPMIVVNDIASVKEALNNADLAGRPNLLLAQLRHPTFNLKGIIAIDGEHWQEQRRFFLRNLRDFGFGRRFQDLELQIKDEITSLVNMIKNGPKYLHEKEFVKPGRALCPTVFYATTCNIFLRVLSIDRVSRIDQHRIYKAGHHAHQFQANADDYGRMFGLVPWITSTFPNLSGYKECREHSQGLYAFAKEIVLDQYNSYDHNIERHFLDIYFKEMQTNPKYEMDQLILSCFDFLLPTFTILSTAITFLMQRVIMEPEVLHKMQNEIDSIVGTGRRPVLDDREHLPYTEASLREIMRLETAVPSGVAHAALADTKLCGYDLPKGGFVITGLQAANVDETKFQDSTKFQPERFLDVNGRLQLSKDLSLPFGAGKRLCPGETFSRNVLFLICSALVQGFNIKEDIGSPLPKLEDRHTGNISMTPHFWVRFESR